MEKSADSFAGHYRMICGLSDPIDHLEERLKRIDELAFVAAATIPAQMMGAHYPGSLHDNVPVGKSVSEALIDRLTALQKEFEQDGAHLSYQLVYPRK